MSSLTLYGDGPMYPRPFCAQMKPDATPLGLILPALSSTSACAAVVALCWMFFSSSFGFVFGRLDLGWAA